MVEKLFPEMGNNHYQVRDKRWKQKIQTENFSGCQSY